MTNVSQVPASSIDGDLEDFFENAAVALHIVSAEGVILRANKAELALLGYPLDEYRGRPVADFHADRSVIDDILARLGRGEKLDNYPARLRAKDGSIRHVLITSNAQFRDGEFVQTRCFTTDVTETRRTEHRFHQILDALPAAVYTTDAAGRITYYNQAAVDLAGRRPRIGVDEWCVTWRLYREDGTPLPHDQCPMAVALKENRPVRGIEAWAERPDGTRIPFLPHPTPIYDETDSLVGAINMLVDISAHKQAQKTKTLLIDELNHRVKNTLAVVQALAGQTLRRAKSPTDFVESFSGRIAAMARAHTRLSNTSWKGAELAALLNDALLLGGEVDPRITFSGPSLTLVSQQALNLALVFHELATNARKYGALAAPDGNLAVTWSIDSDENRSLTLRWVETSCADVLKPAAAGFGTTFIQQIVAPDGEARMSCGATGVTWDFEIRLPPVSDFDVDELVLSRGMNKREAGAASVSTIRGKRVLVVEDESLIAMELTHVIQDAGGEVVASVATVAEGLRAIQETKPDSALLDANLGGQRSDELASALAARGIPFAFLTGYSREALPERFRDAKLIAKPFMAREVIEALAELSPRAQVVRLQSART